MELRFSVVSKARPVDLLAPGFVELREQFDSPRGLRDYEQLTPTPEERPGHLERRHGVLSVGGDEPHFTVFRSATHQAAPYSTVTVDVEAFADSGGEQDAVFAGLVKDERNYVMAWFSRASGIVGLDAVRDGELQTLAVAETEVSAPCRFAFSLTGATVAALVETADGFRPLVHARLPQDLDLRQPGELAEYRNAFGTRASSGTIALNAVEAGYFGQTGLRDPHVVTHADGSPYIRHGKVFLSATNAGLGFFQTAHTGVWTLDLADLEVEQVGQLFFQRDGSDTVFGDHAGHIVRDDDNDRWIVATSTWGDFSGDGVGISYVTLPLTTDVLHGVQVLDTAPLSLPVDDLPSEAVGQWDPHLVRIDDRWYVGFVNARAFFDFYPALARSEPGRDFTELGLVGADARKNETEGPVMQRVDGQWYLLASNGDASPAAIRDQYPVYDLTMTQTGTLPAPHPTNIPWPMVFPVPISRERTRWLMVTFDGTSYHRDMLGYGTHGDLVVLEADQVTRGHEFPARPTHR